MRSIKNVLWCSALILSSAACDSDSGSEPIIPGALIGLSSSVQSAVVGTDVILNVQVNDLQNRPMAGVTVNWAIAAGNGSIAATSVTDAQGKAFEILRVGGAVGEQRVTASVTGGLSTTFTINATPGPLAALVITPANPSIEAGATQQITVTGADQFGNPVPVTGAIYTSSASGVATISSSGVITAVAPGTATITVTAGGRQQTTTLTVTPGTPTTLTVTPSTRNLFAPGDTATLTAVVKNALGVTITTPVTWSSNNNAVVTVSQTGKLTAVGEGTAQIIASAGAARDTATVGVSFGAATVTFVPTTIPSLGALQRQLLTVELRNARGDLIAGTINYTSSDTTVAAVLRLTNNSAYVYAVGPGTATITATSGLASSNIPVTVSGDVATAFIRPEAVALHAFGASTQLRLSAFNSAGVVANPPVTWESSNPDVVSVDQNGVVTLLPGGNANVDIRAVFPGGVVSRNVLGDATIFVPELSFTSPRFSLYGVGDAFQTKLVRRNLENHTSIAVPTVTYASTDSSIATVSASGVVTAVGPGNATITATGEGLTASALVTVVGNAASFTIANSLNPLVLGSAESTSTLTYEVRDANGSLIPGARPTFTSSNPEVAVVIGNYIHAVGRGTTTITASFGGLTAQTFTVTVL